MEIKDVIHCEECKHCFKCRRSKTGYSCEVLGYDDFASDTIPTGYCHKAKPKQYPIRRFGHEATTNLE